MIIASGEDLLLDIPSPPFSYRWLALSLFSLPYRRVIKIRDYTPLVLPFVYPRAPLPNPSRSAAGASKIIQLLGPPPFFSPPFPWSHLPPTVGILKMDLEILLSPALPRIFLNSSVRKIFISAEGFFPLLSSSLKFGKKGPSPRNGRLPEEVVANGLVEYPGFQLDSFFPPPHPPPPHRNSFC